MYETPLLQYFYVFLHAKMTQSNLYAARETNGWLARLRSQAEPGFLHVLLTSQAEQACYPNET